MRRAVRNVLIGAGALVGIAAAALGGYAWSQTSAYESSIDRVYDVPVPVIAVSHDPTVLARGEHLARSVAPCAIPECHGADLGGGRATDAGPIGTFVGPNISAGGLGLAYTDGELARLITHGIKKDGRTVRFMPVQDFGWISDSDVVALISWIRTQPAVDRPNQPTVIKPLGKVLDRRDQIVIDVARRIDHAHREAVPAPSEDASYGAFIARGCTGCHGEHLSGGRIPGTPSSIPVPLNLTPDATGLKDWTYADFDALLTRGIRRGGLALHPFMPISAFSHFDETEKRALWAHLQSLQPLVFGSR